MFEYNDSSMYSMAMVIGIPERSNKREKFRLGLDSCERNRERRARGARRSSSRRTGSGCCNQPRTLREFS